MKLFLLGSFFWLLTTACEKEPLPPADGFQFVLLPSFCDNGGMAFNVVVTESDKETYAYLWDLDGQALGHDESTSCVCGNLITVYVTRLSDGVRLQKSMAIVDCLRE
jgi:hypothetical protein